MLVFHLIWVGQLVFDWCFGLVIWNSFYNPHICVFNHPKRMGSQSSNGLLAEGDASQRSARCAANQTNSNLRYPAFYRYVGWLVNILRPKKYKLLPRKSAGLPACLIGSCFSCFCSWLVLVPSFSCCAFLLRLNQVQPPSRHHLLLLPTTTTTAATATATATTTTTFTPPPPTPTPTPTPKLP